MDDMKVFGSSAVVTAAVPLAERFNTAQAIHGSAVAVFDDVAADLAEAEAQYRSVVAEADEEITRLTHIRDEAINAALRAKASTVAILDLARGIKSNE